MPDKKKKKPNTIFGYTPEELQELLSRYAEKVPFFGDVARALRESRERIEGKRPGTAGSKQED